MPFNADGMTKDLKFRSDVVIVGRINRFIVLFTRISVYPTLDVVVLLDVYISHC